MITKGSIARLFSSILTQPPPTSTLFPYTTLFRSHLPPGDHRRAAARSARPVAALRQPMGDSAPRAHVLRALGARYLDRKSTRLNSSHVEISYAVFCLKKKSLIDMINTKAI